MAFTHMDENGNAVALWTQPQMLGRMDERQLGVPASGPVELYLDRTYPDERLQRIFTNLTYIGTDEARKAAGVPKPNDLPGE